jgi:membrane associated rhomboid family serine protease
MPHQPRVWRAVPWVAVALAAVNSAVFVYGQTLSRLDWERFIYAYGVRPFELRHLKDIQPTIEAPNWTPALTAWSINDGWLAIVAAVLCLVLFAPTVEHALGHGLFLVLYCACGIATVGVLLLAAPETTTPVAGAIGPVFGVLGAYSRLFPVRWRRVVFFATPYGAVLVLQYFGIVESFNAVTVETTGLILLVAVAGFAIGFGLAYALGLARSAARYVQRPASRAA